MLRLAFDFIIAWREIRARPNAYSSWPWRIPTTAVERYYHSHEEISPRPWETNDKGTGRQLSLCLSPRIKAG